MVMHTAAVKATGERIRRVLMVFCALALFLAGLVLLFAPPRDQVSRGAPDHFPSAGDGWIMGANSYQANPLAGG